MIDAIEPKPPTVATLRSWAANPVSGTPTVPLHQSTVRAVADEIERLQRQAIAYRALIDAHNAHCTAVCYRQSGALCIGEPAHCIACPQRFYGIDVSAVDTAAKEPGAR